MSLCFFDDSRLVEDPCNNVDYLSHKWAHEDLWETRKYVCSEKRGTKHNQRLENALWRAWPKQTQQLPTLPSQSLKWDKESDTTWLFGPWKSLSNSSMRQNNSSGQKISLPLEPRFFSESFKQKLHSSHVPHMQRRCSVHFDEQVQQTRCLPEGLSLPNIEYTALRHLYNVQEYPIVSDSGIYPRAMTGASSGTWRTIVPLPATCLKSCQKTWQFWQGSNLSFLGVLNDILVM